MRATASTENDGQERGRQLRTNGFAKLAGWCRDKRGGKSSTDLKECESGDVGV